MQELLKEYEAVIGLEVHARLNTLSKLFCRCENRFGAEPNTLICPVCAGLPGALPVLNRKALSLGMYTALAVGAEVAHITHFDRKHYFYPDLPKGYQITQVDRPLARGGSLCIDGENGDEMRVSLARIHLEEDAGKSLHQSSGSTVVDLNRCGVPLLEIVTRPDLRSPGVAHRFLTALKLTLRYLEVSDCSMEKGSLRCDANISVRPRGHRAFGTKVEIKNLNSFKGVQRALEHEFERQAKILEAGTGRIVQETRLFDARTATTRPMRSKEESHDYRYFPDPDLPPVRIREDEVDEIRKGLPELPRARVKRLTAAYGIPDYDGWVLVEDPRIAGYFEAVAKHACDGKAASNWVMTEVMHLLNEGMDIETFPVPPDRLADLIHLQKKGKLNVAQARVVFAGMVETGLDARAVAEKRGLEQLSDAEKLQHAVQQAFAANARAVADMKRGKLKARDAIMGHVMRLTRGQANPTLVQELIDRQLLAE